MDCAGSTATVGGRGVGDQVEGIAKSFWGWACCKENRGSAEGVGLEFLCVWGGFAQMGGFFVDFCRFCAHFDFFMDRKVTQTGRNP